MVMTATTTISTPPAAAVTPIMTAITEDLGALSEQKKNTENYAHIVKDLPVFSSILLQTLPINVVLTPGCPLPPLPLPPFGIETVVAEAVVVVESVLPPWQTKLLKNSLTFLELYSKLELTNLNHFTG